MDERILTQTQMILQKAKEINMARNGGQENIPERRSSRVIMANRRVFKVFYDTTNISTSTPKPNKKVRNVE